MQNPKHLLYTKEHEWADYNDDYVSIGITDYAQSQLGDVIFIEFPNIGQKIVAGNIFGEIEAVKTVSDLFSPISGTIVEINENIEENPNLINDDPYGDGWIVRIKPSNLKEKEGLMDYLKYKEFVGQ
tara:strand:+ start:4855 stop:5235 length:381 start_codon:yes stop_codon:yes gene_type:complete